MYINIYNKINIYKLLFFQKTSIMKYYQEFIFKFIHNTS